MSDINNSRVFNGNSTISFEDCKCISRTDSIPNNDFNDGAQAFPNDVSEQDNVFEITASPIAVANPPAISLNVDNAILLNGVKVDLLAAACFGVGDGKIDCKNHAHTHCNSIKYLESFDNIYNGCPCKPLDIWLSGNVADYISSTTIFQAQKLLLINNPEELYPILVSMPLLLYTCEY